MLAELYNVEMDFRIIISGNKIVKRSVDSAEKIGTETQKEVVLGKDLIGVKRKETSDIITALVGIGPEQENGTRVIVRIENDEALERWGRNGRHMWGIYEAEPADVRASRAIIEEMTRQELERRINTLIQYEVDAAIIDFLFGRGHEKAILGDTIRVKDPSFEPPLYLDARIIGIKRRPSDPSQKKYTLGDFIEYAEEDIVMKRWELISRLMEVKFEIAKSSEPPENPIHNQLWIDTSDRKKTFIKDGTRFRRHGSRVQADLLATRSSRIYSDQRGRLFRRIKRTKREIGVFVGPRFSGPDGKSDDHTRRALFILESRPQISLRSHGPE